MPEAVWIGFAFCIGLLVRLIGLPPLVGYLAAGFLISSQPSLLAEHVRRNILPTSAP